LEEVADCQKTWRLPDKKKGGANRKEKLGLNVGRFMRPFFVSKIIKKGKKQ